jgi:hypothetical protein
MRPENRLFPYRKEIKSAILEILFTRNWIILWIIIQVGMINIA